MRALLFLVFCLFGSACLATPVSDFEKALQLAREVIGLPKNFGADRKMSDEALVTRFPVGSPFERIFQEIRVIRRAHRNCTEYFREPDRLGITLSIFIYFDDGDSFGKESVDFQFTFDEHSKLKSVTYAQSSTAL